MTTTSSAEALAADLAGAQVDPNEAQKALAYLRGARDPKAFMAYLRAINKDGRAVIRSNQTMGYYRDLLAACERHLHGMQYQEMAATLGWAIRLLRYYRAVPEAVQRRTASPKPMRQETEGRPERQQDGRSSPQPEEAPPPPLPPVELKKLDVGIELTGNRKGELRVPSLGRGVRVELNLKDYALPKGKTVVGFISRQDAGGSMSGGFRGTLVDVEVDGATLYLVVKPAPKPKEGA